MTTAVVEDATAEFKAERNDCCLDRFCRLERGSCSRRLERWQRPFEGEILLSHAACRRAIKPRGSDGPDRAEATDGLNASVRSGAWAGHRVGAPAIPRLMDYTPDRTPPDEGGATG